VFHKVLIANRGEIAVRVIRACREMGVRSVAVYSEADRRAPHVLEADEAYLIGPPPSAQSYLLGEVIVQTAIDCGAEAVHPGYGFLAERASFARTVEDAGLVFIGPAPETIDAMGDKTEARKRMEAAGVPIVPGLVDAIRDPEELVEAAEGIGYPVLLKAAAGGGGKGMRVVEDPEDLVRSFEAAAREALAAFGDESVYIEKYLDSPRHIEIQILGDGRGKVIHLGERECSIQRRHQKLVEEAPSPVCTPALREAMGSAAVRAGEAVDYRGAGTVEFLFKDGEFYFLEMNTRLQVEHPVTELVHGIDLVHWQLRIAAGEPLTRAQEDLRVEGHAIECRITSEDPFNGFLPSTGVVGHLDIPAGPGVRWDGGIAPGFEVGLHYDPLLGKLIVHAPDREAAIRRMGRALRELAISGLETSVPFHRRVMEEPDFRRGDLSIRYLEEHPDLLEAALPSEDLRVVVVAAALLEEQARRKAGVTRVQDGQAEGLSPWQQAVHPARRGT
jgi:acetyl-CoA carboxylase biotin carboxylase subunit